MFDLLSTNEKTENLNFNEILTYYLKYWYLFVISIILCIASAYIYIRYFTLDQYRISSIVLIKDKDLGKGVQGEESLADLGLLKPSGNIEDQIGILKSTSLMEKVITQLSLNVRYKVKGNIKDIELYKNNVFLNVIVEPNNIPNIKTPFIITPIDSSNFVIKLMQTNGNFVETKHQYDELIGTIGQQFKITKNPLFSTFDTTPLIINFTDIENLAKSYMSKLTIEPVNDTGSLLRLNFLDSFPERGKDILRTLIDIYAEESVRYQNQLAISTIEIIDDRLKLLTSEITDVEKNIASYKRQNDLTNVSSDAAIYLQSAQQANSQIEEYQIQIDILNSIENYLKREGEDKLVPSSLNIQDPTLSALIEQFNSQQLEKKSLLRSTPEDNPLVVNLERNLNDLLININENLKNIKEGLIIAQNNAKKNAYQTKAKIAHVPAVEQTLLAINRDQGIKQQIYLYLLQKREEEALSLEAPISNTRIIDYPKSNNYPISPNKMSIYLGGIIFGIFLPFSLLYFKKILNNKIQDINDIKRLTNIPILGEITHSPSSEKLVVNEYATDTVSELFRLMRFNLKYLSINSPNKVLLITSSMEGEGKSFFTLNFGACLANSGKQVILLGMDLRSPNLLSQLNIKNELGITDYIIDNSVKLNNITKPSSKINGLYLIGSGQVPPNANQLILNERIGELINDLKTKYDYILLDTSPIGRVSDAYALSPHVDSLIYIARHNYTTKEQIKTVNEIFVNNKFKNPTIVLNDVIKSKNFEYGYGRII